MIKKNTKAVFLDGGFVRNKAAQEYIKGKITISQAAHQAGLSLFDMEKYLIDQGFKSDYSIEDLEREMELLG